MHGPELETKHGRQTNRQTGGGGGEYCSLKMCQTVWLACWVSALDWRNQVDGKLSSGRGQSELLGLKRFFKVQLRPT